MKPRTKRSTYDIWEQIRQDVTYLQNGEVENWPMDSEAETRAGLVRDLNVLAIRIRNGDTP